MKWVARIAFVSLVGANSVFAQEAPATPEHPIEMVARAEELCAKGSKEAAIVLLWMALERFGKQAVDPASAAGTKAAMALLQTHDPLHGERQALYASHARARTELAGFYRGRKWYTFAGDQLDLADDFDSAIGQQERAALLRANAKPLAPSITEPKGYSLLHRVETLRVNGPWVEWGDTLVCGAHKANKPFYEWTIDARHEDCELSVEFSSQAGLGHDCSLLLGLDAAGPWYHFIAAYYADSGRYDLVLWENTDQGAKRIAWATVGSLPDADGFHRMSLRVHGKSLRAQLGAAKALEVDVKQPPRGRFGLAVGIDNQDSAPITLREFRLQPWPPLGEAEALARATAAAKARIAESITGAAVLIQRKEPEAGARRLLVARQDALRLPPGALRDSLVQSTDEYLNKADSLRGQARRLDLDGARKLCAMADK